MLVISKIVRWIGHKFGAEPIRIADRSEGHGTWKLAFDHLLYVRSNHGHPIVLKDSGPLRWDSASFAITL